MSVGAGIEPDVRGGRVQDPILPVVGVGVLLGVAGVWTAVTHHPSNALVVRYIVVGLAYLAVGYRLGASGHGRLGLLLAGTGALWFIPELQDTGNGVLVGFSIMFADVYVAAFGHSLLAFPSGKIQPRIGVWLVGTGYLLATVGGALKALTYQPYYWQSCDCPHNRFAVWHTESVYNGVNNAYNVVALILGISLIALLAFKLRQSGARGGAVLRWAPVAAVGLILVSTLVRNQFDLSSNGTILWLWVEGIGYFLATVPFVALARGREPSIDASRP
jgi:hypothetical protein